MNRSTPGLSVHHQLLESTQSAFFIVQPSHPYMTTGKTIALTRRTFVDKVMSLLFNMLSSEMGEVMCHCLTSNDNYWKEASQKDFFNWLLLIIWKWKEISICVFIFVVYNIKSVFISHCTNVHRFLWIMFSKWKKRSTDLKGSAKSSLSVKLL